MQQNAQERCVIYENLHNENLEKIIYMKSTKNIWDGLQVLYGRNNKEVKKMRKEEEK